MINNFNLFLILAFTGLWTNASVMYAQSNQEPTESAVIAKVDLLFDAMRANDSTMVQDLFSAEANLSSIYTDKNSGKVVKKTSPAHSFITAIGRPHDQTWDEKIWSYEVQIDGPMAYVWTEYTFYLDERLLHCGVNVFEMMNTDMGWQISGITDTRRTGDCIAEPTYAINELIDAWHKAAAVADEDVFFGSMADDGIYIGTDATERWTRDEMFELLGKYFERETAWDFTAIERNVTLYEDGQMAWFDELLDTWMGTCRSSGVVRLIDGEWKIAHYHLSIAVPNDKVDEYLELIGVERK